MIKENELRINNLVKYKKGHLAIIKGFRQEKGKNFIDVEGVEDNYINGTYETSHFYPVNLSLELLRACRFKFHNKDLNVGYGIFGREYHFYMSNYAKKIKYFHEMQNLFFDLVGKELKYSIKERENG